MHMLLTGAVVLVLVSLPTAQTPPRDPPAPLRADLQLERHLRAEIDGGRAPETAYSELARLLRGRGDSDAADTVELQWRDRFPSSVAAHTAAAGVYHRRGDFDNAIAELRTVAVLQPQSAEARHRIAVYFWDKSRSDPNTDATIQMSYITQGLEAEDQALSISPDYAEALTYKNILLRLKANLTQDPTQKARLIADADELRNRVIEMQRRREATPLGSPSGANQPVIRRGTESFDETVARLMPVRVGGDVPAPRKIRDARPRYPMEAERQNAQGTVMVSVVIDDGGRVANARILRSVPLLDAAALDCVRQWLFTTTMIDRAA